MLGNLVVYKDQIREVISIGEEQLTLRSIVESIELLINLVDVVTRRNAPEYH